MTEFIKLRPADYLALKGFFINQRSRLSIYSLPSLIAWNSGSYETYYRLVDQWLLMASSSKSDEGRGYLILPLSAEGEIAPEEMYDLAKSLGYGEYRFIPEDYLRRQDPGIILKYFEPTEQAEYEDYIYEASELAELPGRRFTKKRNHIHQFEREYLDLKRVAMEGITDENKRECREFLDEWCRDYPCEGEEGEQLNCERKAIHVTLDNMELFEMCGLAVRIDGRLSAFAFVSRLTEDTGVLNYQKAFSQHRGLYQFLDRECIRGCFSKYAYVNKESDMGLPGLAQAKKSYFPAIRLKSYRLKLKTAR